MFLRGYSLRRKEGLHMILMPHATKYDSTSKREAVVGVRKGGTSSRDKDDSYLWLESNTGNCIGERRHMNRGREHGAKRCGH